MRREIKNEGGFTIIENLVAVMLVSVTIVGASSLIATSVISNGTARSYASLVGEVQSKLDGYRQQSFNTVLANIGSSPSAITNGQTATVNSSSSSARATFVTTFTAVKNNSTGIPQAVKIKINATQRRGRLGSATYSFETMIANVS